MTSSKTALLAAATLLVTAPIALAQSTPSNATPATQTTPNNGPQSTSQNATPNGQTTAQPNTTGTTATSGSQTSPATAASSAPTFNGSIALSAADKRYLSRDTRSEAYETQISQLAEQKATEQNIKQYASMVVQDHQQTTQELQQLAQQAGVTLPTSPTKSDATKINRLQQLNGKTFDRQYVQDIKQANQQDLSRERSEDRSTKSQAMKQLLSQFQQVDQKHVHDAQNLPATGNNKS